jgi:hypothetical protein
MPPKRGRRTRGTPNIGKPSKTPEVSKTLDVSKIPNMSKTLDMSKMQNLSKMQDPSKTANKSRDADMVNELSMADTASELLIIKDGLSQLKPTNFKCELLNYDNVKN